jgi:pyruvate dehydrogenase E1 component beta subunit
MEPKRLYRSVRGPLGPEPEPDGIPRAKVVHSGSDVSLISYGPSVPLCLQAAGALAERGVACEVLDLRTLWPLDEEAVIDSVRRTGRCVVVHEAPRSCGVGAEVAALVAERAAGTLRAPVLRIAGLDVPFPMFMLEGEYLPDPERIALEVEELLA